LNQGIEMAFIKNTVTPASTVDERSHARDLPGLTAQLADADPAVRRWAARDLLTYPQATEALVDRLRCEDDISVREVILTSLTRLGGTVAVAGLVQCLRSEDAQVRNEAIEAMKGLPTEVALIMDGLLRDPDSDVRIMAVNVLESLQHPKVETWLIEVIERDPVINVCGTAVDLLGEVGSPLAQDALERLQHKFPDEPYIQFATRLALKRIAKT
jgi:HEAT repeat protein